MIEVRKVESLADIRDVERLAREIWIEHYSPIIGRAQVSYMLARFQSRDAIARQIQDGHEYYVALLEGGSIGYVAVIPNETDATLMISKFYVKRACRGHGAGKRMLQIVESLCVARGLSSIWLTVNRNNSHSIAWYGRMGFRNTGPVVQDIGGGFVMDDFRFEKSLAP